MILWCIVFSAHVRAKSKMGNLTEGTDLRNFLLYMWYTVAKTGWLVAHARTRIWSRHCCGLALAWGAWICCCPDLDVQFMLYVSAQSPAFGFKRFCACSYVRFFFGNTIMYELRIIKDYRKKSKADIIKSKHSKRCKVDAEPKNCCNSKQPESIYVNL